MLSTLRRVALALILALVLPLSAFADPPPAGEVITLQGGIVCTDRDATVALAVTPSGQAWNDMMAAYAASGVCGRVTMPISVIVGDSIDAGIDAGAHWWALEVMDTSGNVVWLLYGEKVVEPTGWRI